MKIFAQIHGFYLNFAFWLAVLLGFLVSSIFDISQFSSISWLFASLILAIFSLFWRRRVALILVILAGILLSFNRFSNFQIQKKSFERFVGSQVEIRGIIFEDADFNKEKGEISLKIAVRKINSKSVSGQIFAKIKTSKNLRRSDEVILNGKMSSGFGSYSGSIYRGQISKIIRRDDFVRDLRDDFAGGVSKNIPSPELELGLGYLLGQKNSLPSELEKALRLTALTHIVVASGYNLTVLVNFSRRKFGRFSKKLGFFASVILICAFVLVVGFSPSMTRAGIVALLGVIFWNFGRRPNPYFLLIFVAALTLIFDPSNIFNLGWQLSFGSFFGVMILAPLLKEFLFEKPENLGALTSTFFETISAQIATLPLIIFTFGAFSPISILANMVVLPFVPLAMLLTFLTGIFAQILPLIAQFFGFLAELILKFSIWAIEFFSKTPGAQMELKIGIFEVVIFYFVIFLVVFILEKACAKNRKMPL